MSPPRFGFVRTCSLFIMLGLVHGGCGGSNQGFKNALSQGELARREHNYTEEQAAFERAVNAARNENERAEALYRMAHSQLREGQTTLAARSFEDLAKKYPHSSRAARAWLDAGRCWEKLDNNTAAAVAYEQVWRNYPESGNAITAAKLTTQLEPGKDMPLQWKALLAKNQSEVLRPALLYELGLSLEEAAPAEAIVTFEEVAKLAPLPEGTYSDEALLHAAKLRRAARDFEGALQTLQILTVPRGSAALVGSYNRPAYVEALLLQGKIHRDDLQNWQRAQKAFSTLVERFPESRLVDDALWEAAVTDYQSQGNACQGIEKLRKAKPRSAFLRCARSICPTAEQPVASNCNQ